MNLEKEHQDFEKFMMRYKPEFRDFDKVGDSTYSNTLTGIAYDSYLQGIKSQQSKIDELQARVDEITNHVGINFDEERDDDQHSYWSGYNQAMRELNDILKGNKDEN